ncbi:MAG: ribosome biogenesis factor YjgA [Pseudomonadota bacterium]
MSRHSVHDDLDDDDLYHSKTEQKKAMERLQALGERLGALPNDQLRKMPVSDTLMTALLELKRLKAHEAVRRHKQYIGKLMRDEDEEAILNILNPMTSPTLNKQLELLIDRILNQGDPAINDVVRRYPAAERHTLRQHVRATLKEANELAEKPAEQQEAAERPARRKLLMYLREIAALAD